ncbi:MAG: type II secretion system F family protein [Planctomycetota bacterium]
MKHFKYQAKNFGGKTVSGTLTGNDQDEVIGELRKRNLVVLNVRPAGAQQKGFLSLKRTPRPNVKKDELVVFTRQLSTMISAGIPLLEGLEILHEQTTNPGFAYCLDCIIEDIRGGSDLSASMEKFPKVFTNIFVSMIKAGEVSGQLDEILVRLAEYLEAAAKLKREIRSAMTYPVVSLVLVLGITAFLMLGIVPKFQDVFISLDIPLPGLTRFVLNLSLGIKANLLPVLGGVAGVVALVVGWRGTKKGRYQWDWMMLHLPVFGTLFQKVALSRFSRTFSTLIKSGVPILGALEIVSKTAGNEVISKAIDSARENVRQGDTLSEPLSESPVFPPMVTKMIGIGEKSGSLELLLEKISVFYDEQVSAAVKSLTSMIEPLMIGTMGVMVGGIVLAVFLPIFELQKKLASG